MKLEIRNPETGEWLEMVCAPEKFNFISHYVKIFFPVDKNRNMIRRLKRKRK